MSTPSRREFLKSASVLAGATAAGALACSPPSTDAAAAPSVDASGVARVERATGFDRTQLDALAATVLPASLGDTGVRAATAAFIAWADGYDPVAEEMHGYGYADVRYLPPDPSPAWRAQLDGLDALALRTRSKRFAELEPAARREVLAMALRRERGGDRLPAPLGASHVAIALLSHWTSSPAAWNLALGTQVSPLSCRPLGDALRKPLPVVEAKA